MAKDTAALRKANVSTARSTADFVVYLQDDIARKDELIRKLKDKNRDLEFAASQEVRRLQDEHAAATAAAEVRAQSAETTLQGKIGALQEQLSDVLEFKENKSRYDSELDAVKELLDAERKRRQRETAEMQRRMLGLKSDWREARSTEYASMLQQARGEAQRLLDTDVKRMVLNNKRMEEELTFHKEQAELARREKAALGSQAKALAREVALFADKEALFAKKAAFRSRENRDLKAKVKSLEQSLGEVAGDFEAHRRHVAASVSQESEELVSEVAALRSLVANKNKELSSMKRLAEMILSQRTEVEQFLLEALAQVKGELRTQQAQGARAAAMAHASRTVQGTGGTGTLVPGIRANASVASASGATGAALGQGGQGALQGSGAFNLTAPTGSKARHAKNMVQGRGGLGAAGSASLGLGATLPTRMASSGGERGASTLGRGGGAGQASVQDKKGKVHWRDLSASQRERVLHLLFAKLNNLPTSKVAPSLQKSQAEGKAEQMEHDTFEMDGPFGLAVGGSQQVQFAETHSIPAPPPAGDARGGLGGGDGRESKFAGGIEAMQSPGSPPSQAEEEDALGNYMASLSSGGDL